MRIKPLHPARSLRSRVDLLPPGEKGELAAHPSRRAFGPPRDQTGGYSARTYFFRVKVMLMNLFHDPSSPLVWEERIYSSSLLTSTIS